ncbi:hypothetical protein LNKW23_05800 [Paralimibaculum aggregatum]|uniref:Uncharacterized protein n=1 Tax=Paralimibaculum aggregatum TaxID=3036245 RepID=A0ABQ6LI85_9RHOB|nr:hypothetical protein LNKW23_05800 [Limibaculum sp. NKW23]
MGAVDLRGECRRGDGCSERERRRDVAKDGHGSLSLAVGGWEQTGTAARRAALTPVNAGGPPGGCGTVPRADQGGGTRFGRVA